MLLERLWRWQWAARAAASRIPTGQRLVPPPRPRARTRSWPRTRRQAGCAPWPRRGAPDPDPGLALPPAQAGCSRDGVLPRAAGRGSAAAGCHRRRPRAPATVALMLLKPAGAQAGRAGPWPPGALLPCCRPALPPDVGFAPYAVWPSALPGGIALDTRHRSEWGLRGCTQRHRQQQGPEAGTERAPRVAQLRGRPTRRWCPPRPQPRRTPRSDGSHWLPPGSRRPLSWFRQSPGVERGAAASAWRGARWGPCWRRPWPSRGPSRPKEGHPRLEYRRTGS